MAQQDESRGARERDFWGHHVPSVEECLAQVRGGPDPNTEAMLRAIEPVSGARVIDFACGGGVTSAWLALRGAEVVGVDLSEISLERARSVNAALGLKSTFMLGLGQLEAVPPFDAVVGRYALHHTDVATMSIALARHVRPGGKAAFVETFGTNPVLRAARATLPGRLGVPKLGTADERPLGRNDLAALRSAFGQMKVTCAKMYLFRILDRQVLGYRSPRVSRVLGGVDDLIARVPGSRSLSYFQVVELRKTLVA